MILNAKCLICDTDFLTELNPISGRERDADDKIIVCPECGDAYYSLNGKDGNATIEDCIVNNRDLIKEDKMKCYKKSLQNTT